MKVLKLFSDDKNWFVVSISLYITISSLSQVSAPSYRGVQRAYRMSPKYRVAWITLRYFLQDFFFQCVDCKPVCSSGESPLHRLRFKHKTKQNKILWGYDFIRYFLCSVLQNRTSWRWFFLCFCSTLSPKIEANYILFIESCVSAVWLMTSRWLTVCCFFSRTN